MYDQSMLQVMGLRGAQATRGLPHHGLEDLDRGSMKHCKGGKELIDHSDSVGRRVQCAPSCREMLDPSVKHRINNHKEKSRYAEEKQLQITQERASPSITTRFHFMIDANAELYVTMA